MKLTIEIPCNSGIEMEIRLNKAIEDFSKALKKKGFREINLVGYEGSIDNLSYVVKIEPDKP